MDFSKLSDQDLLALKKQDYSSLSDAGLQMLAAQKKESPSGFMRGLRDPIDGLAQLAAEAMPDFIESGLNRFNNWLADAGVPLERLPEGGVSEMVANQERDYQKARAESGESGVDWGRIGGNIISPANLALALRGQQLLGNGYRAAAGIGAASAAAQPVIGDDFWKQKAIQTGVGAVTGPLTQAGVNAGARVIKPNSSAQVAALKKEGVTPTMGQALGGMANRVEEKMQSLPLVGDAISAGRRRALMEFNRAAMNRALSPVGKTLPKAVSPGRSAVEYVERQLSDEYNRLLPNLVGVLDGQMRADLTTIAQMAQAMPKSRGDQLIRIINDEVMRRFTNYGRASGETLKAIESNLGRLARTYGKSIDGDQRQLADAIHELQSSLRSMVLRANPGQGDKLQKINEGWANYAVLRRAAASLGTDEGVFTPAQLLNAVKAKNSTVDKGGFSKGQALMQDLAEPGKTVLGQKVPNSGTTDRALLNLAALGGGAAIEPSSIAVAGAMSLPYMPGIQNLVTGALASRPQFAQPVADAIRGIAPVLIPGTNTAIQGLFAP